MANTQENLVNRELAESIFESYTLLSYAMQKGFKVDDDIIKTLINFKNYFSMDEDGRNKLLVDEDKFWKAYKDITKIIYDATGGEVTVETISNSMDFYRRKIRIAQKLKKTLFRINSKDLNSIDNYSVIDSILYRYRWTAYIMLTLFVSIQIYWYIGASLSHISYEFSSTIKENDEKNYKTSDLFLSKIYNNGNKNISDTNYFRTEFLKLKQETKEIAINLIANTNQIYKWNSYWRKTSFFTNDTIIKKQINKLSMTMYKSFQKSNINDSIAKTAIFKDSIIKYMKNDLYEDIRSEMTWLQAINKRETQNANFIMNVLQTYFSPILAGLLGTLAFVLRAMSIKVKKDSFSKESRTSYKLRITLGALAGVSIGWFMNNNSTNFSYNPLIIAFIAGYNIEVVFKTIDNAIFNYLDKIKSNQKNIDSSRVKANQKKEEEIKKI